MSFMDRAKEAAEKAGDATKRGVDQAKDKSREVTLKRKFNALAQDLGLIVFRQRDGEGGLDAEVDRLVAEMRGIRTDMDALEDA